MKIPEVETNPEPRPVEPERKGDTYLGYLPAGPMHDHAGSKSSPEEHFCDCLARAQGEFQPIKRSRTVQVAMKAGGSYTFAYAPLETILAACVPALAKHGLSLTQRIRIDKGYVDPQTGAYDEPLHYLVTILSGHGHFIENEVLIFKGDPTAQAYGSAVTYARRLSVTLLLCVAADDDNDGSDKSLVAAPVQRARQAPLQVYSPPVQESENPAPAARSKTFKNAQAIAQANGPKKPQKSIEKLRSTYTEKQLADLEGMIVDARDELLQAAAEGRRVGIEQIWGEIASNEYVATMVWRDLKTNHVDHFATIKAVLKANDAGERTPQNAR